MPKLLVALLSLLVACTSSPDTGVVNPTPGARAVIGPTWLPGDPPLTVHAPSDVAWLRFRSGCEAWQPATGITCVRVVSQGAAEVVIGTDRSNRHYSHEIGHVLIGYEIEGHVPTGPAVMTELPTAWLPTETDFRLLETVWGPRPWR